jgi:hypothetical protein
MRGDEKISSQSSLSHPISRAAHDSIRIMRRFHCGAARLQTRKSFADLVLCYALYFLMSVKPPP